MAPGPHDEVIVQEDPAGRSYAKLVVRGNRIVGLVTVGRPDDGRRAVAAMRDGRDIGSVLDQLRAGDFSALDRSSDPVHVLQARRGKVAPTDTAIYRR